MLHLLGGSHLLAQRTSSTYNTPHLSTQIRIYRLPYSFINETHQIVSLRRLPISTHAPTAVAAIAACVCCLCPCSPLLNYNLSHTTLRFLIFHDTPQPWALSVFRGLQKKQDIKWDDKQLNDKLLKWNESCWKAVVYVIFSSTAFLVTFNEPWFSDPYHFWTEATQFPLNSYVPFKTTLFYLLEIGFYIQVGAPGWLGPVLLTGRLWPALLAGPLAGLTELADWLVVKGCTPLDPLHPLML